jgi:hypothetical protein
MKQIILLIFIIGLITSVFCQDQKIPDDLPMTLGKKSIEEMNNDYKRLLTYDVTKLTKNSQWGYYIRKSFLHLYLNKDSSSYFFNQAFNLDVKGTCRFIHYTDNYYNHLKLNGIKNKDFKWFYEDLQFTNKDSIKNVCDNLIAILQLKSEPISPIGNIIRERDQKYRSSKLDWPKQDSLDKLNRNFIDSIYFINKDLSVLSEYDLDEFSMVIHHSSDMEWNIKWIEIFFDLKSKRKIKGGQYLGIAINRFFHPKSREMFPNPKKLKEYIDKLKLNYPEIAVEYGFEKY